MPSRDPVFTPELIRILKIFIFSSFGLVLLLSFFNGYRANNSGEDRTFQVTDANRIYFLNVRSIYYDRELRRDAGMTLFRHGKRLVSDSLPTLDLVILLHPINENAFVYFDLKNADWPIEIKATTGSEQQVFKFDSGNNGDHYHFLQKLNPSIQSNAKFELIVGDKTYPLWSEEKESTALKSVISDYFRLLQQTN
jgi:hypothetical protein